MTLAIDLLLALAVATAWLSALACLCLPRALDRLHAVAFLNVSAGALVTLAAVLADGVSGRSLKILMMMALLLGWGAVLAHAVGRGLLLREGRSA